MKTLFNRPQKLRPAGFPAAVVAGTTVTCGIAFYAAEKAASGGYAWFLAGIAAAAIAGISAELSWRKNNDRHFFESAGGDLESRLLTAAAARKMKHETENFLNNTGLVVHGLKNEPLSPRGEKMVRLLARESVRFKRYIQKYRNIASDPKIPGEKTRLDEVCRDAVSAWRQKNGRPDIQAVFRPAPASAAGRMNPNLMRNALGRLMDFAAGRLPGGGTIEFQIASEGGRTIARLVLPGETGAGLQNGAAFEPFTESGDDSSLFAAKTMIEACRGTLVLTENSAGDGVLEISLPAAES